jgi:sarcosine oxidase
MIYDTIIIGRGLIGTAAAKYLSRMKKRVALIGPDEATTSREKIVFASHYDAARIQGLVGKDAITTLLNQQSAYAFAQLERETNISFRSEEGCLTVFLDNADFFIKEYETRAKNFDILYRVAESGRWLKKINPEFTFPPSAKGFYELAPAGHINPRLLIQAQQIVFEKNGGEIFNDTVKEIVFEKNLIKMTCFNGQSFQAEKVLLATGAFTNFFHLLKTKVQLKLKSESTIWIKMVEKEALKLQSLPALLYKINQPGLQDIYLIQPVKYPDGNYYLKIGANISGDQFFSTSDEIKNWFDYSGSPDVSALLRALHEILPRLSYSDHFEKRCIVCYTPHGKPFIGPIDERGLFIAAGGNGYGAMSSDSLGNIAATMMEEGRSPGGIFAEAFVPVFEK